MYIQMKAWVFGLVSALLVTSLIGAGVLFYLNGEVKEELAKVKEEKEIAILELEASKENTSNKVKEQANKFLKAFLEMDSSKKKTMEDRIKPYTSHKARQQVVPMGEGVNVSDTKITSKLSDMRLYYSAVAPDKASIFATAKRAISVNNGTATTSETILELQMKLNKGKWIVDDIQLIQ
jgi:uncharacterized protein YlxW (UPF0749 family)